ncbi:MAG TPA: hypothetical protein VHE09_17195 [Rhizomicrobium sp.]|nr:hypothetical protein [Rhizomicrobium sp.]
MANPFMPGERVRSGAFADAADRLGRVASTVKDQQIARNQSGGVRPPESEVYVQSPEEAWTKKYMIQCVGPVCTIQPTEAAAMLLPRFAPAPAMKQASQNVAVAPQKTRKNTAMASIPASRKEAAGPIGLAIGKPIRKRSLIGRLFGR